MAIPSNYIDKINKDGDSRPICPAADKVRVENQNFESGDLDGALNELAGGKANKNETYTKEEVNEKVPLRILATKNGDVITSTTDYGEIANAVKEDWRDAYVVVNNEAIFSFYQVEQNAIIFTRVDAEDGTQAYLAVSSNNVWSIEYSAISGGGEGTVTGVKVGETTYPPNTEGVVDISTPISNKVDKVAGYGLSKNDYTDAEKTKLAELPTDPVTSISVNGGTAQTPNNGNVNLVVETGGLSEEDIDVETNGDGTVVFTFGENTYTINLNHTHENMAKLIVCEESDLPATLDPATIYAQVDDADTPTEIQSLWIAGLEFVGGGGVPDDEPRLTSPRSGATIDFEGETTAEVFIKGRNLTSALTLAVTGDFTVSVNGSTVSSISASDANNGVTLTLTQGSGFSGGTLSISSTEVDTRTCSVEDSEGIQFLDGIKLTGTQWLQTDFVPTTATDIEMKLKFTANNKTETIDENSINFLTCYTLQGTNKQYAHAVTTKTPTDYSQYKFAPIISASSATSVLVSKTDFVLDKSTYTHLHGGSLTFIAGENGTSYTGNTPAVVAQVDPLTIGLYHTSGGVDRIFNKFDLTIYEFTVKENNVTLRHYIPAMKEGVPGLYDTITGHFASSKTSTPVEVVTNS